MTDRIAIGVLARLVSADVVDAVLVECGRKERRVRLLPARVMVYYVMALTLFFGDGYEEVLRRLVGSLRLMGSWADGWVVPSTAAISKARARLGSEPLRVLFARLAVPLAGAGAPGAWCAGRRLIAVDGTNFDLQDTAANLGEFGLPSGGGAFPQVRVVALGECGTHAVVGVALGGARASERDLLKELLGSGRVGPGVMLIADRGFIGYDMWGQSLATGADLLWRVRKDTDLRVIEELPDGTYISLLRDPQLSAKRRDQIAKNLRERVEVTGHAVRVIEYQARGAGPETPETYRLITTITDPGAATVADLAAAYHHRWELESSFDEIKTHQRGGGTVLRSKSPDMVRQEIYSLFLTHYAIRELMCRAAETGRQPEPRRLSFTRTLRAARRQVTDQAAFSP